MLVSAGESERKKRNAQTAMVGIHCRGVRKEKSDISVSSLRKELLIPTEKCPRQFAGPWGQAVDIADSAPNSSPL